MWHSASGPNLAESHILNESDTFFVGSFPVMRFHRWGCKSRFLSSVVVAVVVIIITLLRNEGVASLVPRSRMTSKVSRHQEQSPGKSCVPKKKFREDLIRHYGNMNF